MEDADSSFLVGNRAALIVCFLVLKMFCAFCTMFILFVFAGTIGRMDELASCFVVASLFFGTDSLDEIYLSVSCWPVGRVVFLWLRRKWCNFWVFVPVALRSVAGCWGVVVAMMVFGDSVLLPFIVFFVWFCRTFSGKYLLIFVAIGLWSYCQIGDIVVVTFALRRIYRGCNCVVVVRPDEIIWNRIVCNNDFRGVVVRIGCLCLDFIVGSFLSFLGWVSGA